MPYLQDLVLGAAGVLPETISFLVPVTRAQLFRWCLGQGFRTAKPMLLMTMGEYKEPNGGYLPSVLY